MDYRDNRQRWAESHQVVHFYAGQWCTFTPALTAAPEAEVLQAGTGLDSAQRVCEGAFEIAIAPVTLSWGDGSEVLTKVRQYSPDCLTILVGETQVARGPHSMCSEPQALEAVIRTQLTRDETPAYSPPIDSAPENARPAPVAEQSVELSYLATELVEVEKRAGRLMQDHALGPHPRQLVAGFLRTAERLKFVIDHLGGKEPPLAHTAPEPVNLSNAVIEAMRGLQDRIRDTDARVLAGSLPVLLVHPGDLTTLFHHLLDNALKFCSDKPPHATFRAHEAGSNWIISVSDNGRGMENLSGVDPFQMFTRLPGSESLPGTGIGLAVCRQIAKRYAGDIWYESEPVQGTTIYVRLKVATAVPVKVEMTVSFNTEPVGRISVSNAANKMEITKAALALPAIDARLGEETIKDVQLLDNRVINIVS